MNRFSSLAPVVVPLAALSVGSLGCNSSDSGTIQIITDDEAGTFTEAPAPTELQVLAVQSADASTVLATAQLPTDTINLGKLSEDSPTVSINVTGYDATQPRLVFGASLPVQYANLSGQTIPIFVQRVGEFARLPGTLGDARSSPLLSILQGQYLVVAGGNTLAAELTTQLYDFGQFAPLPSPPQLPVVPNSLALEGTLGWLVNGATGTYFDFSENEYASVTAPSGGSFADVSGGATVVDDTGASYIVGGTRLGPSATAMVLKIDPNDTSNTSYPYGNATWITLSTPRLGASATFVPNVGVVVVGGNVDASASGVEVISETDTTTGAPLPYPADFTFGAGATMFDATHVLVAGGFTSGLQDPGVRELDVKTCLTQTASCTMTWTSLPVVLSSAQTFVWGTGEDALVVGNDFATSATHVFRVNTSGATEVPTKVPHSNAAAVWSPVGTVVVVGGSGTVESFTL